MLDLTKRQIDILARVASGQTADVIAADEYLSPHTVKNTLADAKARVGAPSTANLIALAVSDGTIVRNGRSFTPKKFVHVGFSTVE